MPKTWNERLTDTITFIRTAAVPMHANRRELVADQLQNEYRVQLTQALSGHMSLGTTRNELGRSYGRACILVRVIFLNQDAQRAAAAVAQLNTDLLPLQLSNLLDQAYNRKRQILLDAMTALRANPSVFLAANKISSSGYGAGGARQFAFYYDGMRRRYELCPDNLVNNNIISNGGGWRTVALVIPVKFVAVNKYLSVANNLNALTAVEADAGDTLVVTTQLSGCSVIFENSGRAMRMIHIQPEGGGAGGGFTLVETLRREAGILNGLEGVARQVFGASDQVGPLNYPDDGVRTYVMGVNRGGAWEVHVQRFNPMVAGGPVTHTQI